MAAQHERARSFEAFDDEAGSPIAPKAGVLAARCGKGSRGVAIKSAFLHSSVSSELHLAQPGMARKVSPVPSLLTPGRRSCSKSSSSVSLPSAFCSMASSSSSRARGCASMLMTLDDSTRTDENSSTSGFLIGFLAVPRERGPRSERGDLLRESLVVLLLEARHAWHSNANEPAATRAPRATEVIASRGHLVDSVAAAKLLAVWTVGTAG